MKQVYFSDLNVGDSFEFNGNFCTKVSTKTAILVQYMRTFRISANEFAKSKKRNWKIDKKNLKLSVNIDYDVYEREVTV
jgi:hypothetical protein